MFTENKVEIHNCAHSRTEDRCFHLRSGDKQSRRFLDVLMAQTSSPVHLRTQVRIFQVSLQIPSLRCLLNWRWQKMIPVLTVWMSEGNRFTLLNTSAGLGWRGVSLNVDAAFRFSKELESASYLVINRWSLFSEHLLTLHEAPSTIHRGFSPSESHFIDSHLHLHLKNVCFLSRFFVCVVGWKTSPGYWI